MADLVSQLQGSNAELCSQLFNFTGAIQRDAQPLAVNAEPVEGGAAEPGGADTIAQIPELASQLVTLTKQFDELAAQLPEPLPSRQDQLRLILSLQERVLKGRQELERELEATSAELQHIQQLYGHLADDRLHVTEKECGTG